MTSIGGIRFAELATHPLFLHAELDPEREEDENENDEPARLGDRNRHAKKPGQNAGVSMSLVARNSRLWLASHS